MNTVYVVEFSAHNKNTDAWAHTVKGSNADRDAAKRLWHSECDRLFGSDDFDYVAVIMRTSSGNVEYIDTKNVPAEPEPEGE